MVSYSIVVNEGEGECVLILVVMEDGLVLFRRWVMSQMFHSLNPCCNGRWSRTAKFKTSTAAILAS